MISCMFHKVKDLFLKACILFLLLMLCSTIKVIDLLKFERLKTSGNARYKDRPVKDIYSHIQDALQYACLKVRSGLTPARARAVTKRSSKGWT